MTQSVHIQLGGSPTILSSLLAGVLGQKYI